MSWNVTCQRFLDIKPQHIDYIWLGDREQKWGSAGNERNVTLAEVAAQRVAGDGIDVTFHGLEYKFLRREDGFTYYKKFGKVAVVYNSTSYTVIAFGIDSVEGGQNCRYVLDKAIEWMRSHGIQ